VVLQEAQQLHLQRGGQLADLVEEERAAVRRLDAAAPLGVGARERALLVAEQLALEQRLGDRPAVDRHERPLRAQPQPVDRVGGELLAGAALAEHQHRRVDGRDLSDRREHLLHARARPEHTLEGGGRLLAQLAVLALERREPQRAAQYDLQLLDVDRLHEVVVGALVHGAQRVRAVLAPRDHHHLGAEVDGAQLLKRREAFLDAAGVRRQPEVERHHGRRLGAHLLERFRAAAGEAHVELVGERPAHLAAQILVVVHHQQAGLHAHMCSIEIVLCIARSVPLEVRPALDTLLTLRRRIYTVSGGSLKPGISPSRPAPRPSPWDFLS
jgi:hypothetical protein